MVTTKELRDSSILSLIVKFSGPAIMGMIVMSIYNIVDRIYIGRGVGSLALGGLAVAHPMTMVKMATAMLIGMGAAALVSLRLGENKHDEAEKVLGNAFTLLVAFAITTSILGLIFLTPLMRLFGASDNILPYAVGYMRIILIGNPFHMIAFGCNNLIRAEGSPKFAMYTTLIGGILNIILDPIFIFVFQMGVQGAALATIISQFVQASWVLHYYYKGSGALRLRAANLRVKAVIAKKIVQLGIPNALRTVVNSTIMIILNNSLLYYGGDIAVATMGVMFSIHMVMMMSVMGVSQGAQPVIGFNYGAKLYDRVKQSYFYSVGIATGLITTAYLLVMLFPSFFLGFFSTDAELIALGESAIRYHMMFMPLLGAQAIGANYFQATGRYTHSIFLTLTRQVIFLIPTLLILPRFFGLTGVWLAQPMADFLSFMVVVTFMVFEMRNLENKQQDLKLAHSYN